MAIILDADVIIRAEKETFDLHRWLNFQGDQEFSLAAITVAELWHGVERAAGVHRLKRQRFLEAILESVPILPYTEQTAYEHARIWATLEATGRMIGAYDVIVVATALERDAVVATFNLRHFRQIKGLNVIEPN